MIEIEVTGVSVSKKGRIWLQVSVQDLDGCETPKPGELYELNFIGTKEEKKDELKTT